MSAESNITPKYTYIIRKNTENFANALFKVQ